MGVCQDEPLTHNMSPLWKRCMRWQDVVQRNSPIVGMCITQLEAGQALNQHRDDRNHELYLNYTITFGKYEGGQLEMLRGKEWQSCAVPLVWVEFTADIIEHCVHEVSGERFSVPLFTKATWRSSMSVIG